MKQMHIAVVGGGIFGTTCAIRLARECKTVDLWEQEHDLLVRASGINQYRLHSGYHYPRSIETAMACKRSLASFNSEYGDCVVRSHRHYYGIARDRSLISSNQFTSFCRRLDLEHDIEFPDVLNRNVIDGSFRVDECLIDIEALRRLVWAKLTAANVRVFCGSKIATAKLAEYDIAVVATYAYLNDLIPRSEQAPYQFEVCEKPVVSLPHSFSGISTVIMDGPFMCIDPLGRSRYHVFGHVVNAIHHTNIGLVPDIPAQFANILNKGIVSNPPQTRYNEFIESAAVFFKDIHSAVHIGSMYTVRSVLPYVERTDERPTIVRKLNNKMVVVYSGKITTCVDAANEVSRII